MKRALWIVTTAPATLVVAYTAEVLFVPGFGRARVITIGARHA